MNSPVPATTVPSGVIDRAHPAGRRDHDRPAVLHRPHPGHRQLLVGHLGQPERRVVRGHRQDLRAARRCRGPRRRTPPRSRWRCPPAPRPCRARPRRARGHEAGPVGGREQRENGRAAAGLAERLQRRLWCLAPGPVPGPRGSRRCAAGRPPGSAAPRRPASGRQIARHRRRSSAARPRCCTGSMSEEFSGQITRSGRGTRPAATSAASSAVRRTWLSSTARRWALKSRPEPRHVALHRRDSDLRPAVPGRRSGVAARPATTAAARPARRRSPVAGRRVAVHPLPGDQPATSVQPSSPRPKPHSATA